MDVAAQGGHLALLQAADLPFGIEHHDLDARHIVKPVRHGAARIARGGRKNHQFFIGGAQQACHPAHEPGAEILEGAGRTVEQFQRITSPADHAQGHGEVVKAVQFTLHGLRIEIAAEEQPRQITRQRGVGFAGQTLRKGHVGLRNPFGDEQPPVGGQSHHRGLAQRTAVRPFPIFRTVIIHRPSLLLFDNPRPGIRHAARIAITTDSQPFEMPLHLPGDPHGSLVIGGQRENRGSRSGDVHGQRASG